MTQPKIVMKASRTGETADRDVALLAEQLLQDNWHLPPGGDQSWREQDAARIFHAHGKSGVNDADAPAPVADAGAPDCENGEAYQPGFKRPLAAPMLLPLALATGLGVVIVALAAPGILTAGFWNGPAPAAAADAAFPPRPAADARPRAFAPGSLRPSLALGRPTAMGEAVSIANALPLHKEGSVPQDHAVPVKSRLVSAEHFAPAQKAARHLPPIGEAYFASHAPAVPHGIRRVARGEKPAGAAQLPPIGEAYFASHAPAAADWEAQAVGWDEGASRLRPHRGTYPSRSR